MSLVITNRALGRKPTEPQISRIYHERIALYSHRGGTLPHFKRREVSTYVFTIYSMMLAFHAQNNLLGLLLLASEWAELPGVCSVRDSEPPSVSWAHIYLARVMCQARQHRVQPSGLIEMEEHGGL